jgi:hypothetical protein
MDNFDFIDATDQTEATDDNIDNNIILTEDLLCMLFRQWELW